MCCVCPLCASYGMQRRMQAGCKKAAVRALQPAASCPPHVAADLLLGDDTLLVSTQQPQRVPAIACCVCVRGVGWCARRAHCCHGGRCLRFTCGSSELIWPRTALRCAVQRARQQGSTVPKRLPKRSAASAVQKMLSWAAACSPLEALGRPADRVDNVHVLSVCCARVLRVCMVCATPSCDTCVGTWQPAL